MTYTVVWKPNARDRLAEIWIAAADRNAVTSAANRIDGQLRRDPHNHGEARDERARIVIVPPLAIVYDIYDDDRLVCILSVRRPPEGRRRDDGRNKMAWNGTGRGEVYGENSVTRERPLRNVVEEVF